MNPVAITRRNQQFSTNKMCKAKGVAHARVMITLLHLKVDLLVAKKGKKQEESRKGKRPHLVGKVITIKTTHKYNENYKNT